MTATQKEYSMSQDEFAAMLDDYMPGQEGKVAKGTIIGFYGDDVIVDVGLKSEGRIPRQEFGFEEVQIGDVVDVFVERIERKGETVLSRERARREEVWVDLEKAFKANERVDGMIRAQVKGGFTVDLDGVVAFLPNSQLDVRPIKDTRSLMNIVQPFQILKMDKKRGNIIVSRRAILEESRAEARSELVANIDEGQVLDGTVKNITDYGAFIDLGGVDGLLHVTDISWRRVNHPSEVLKVGQSIKVKVIRFDEKTKRISLGMKQLEEDPWQDVEKRFPVDSRHRGTVTNITDYGAFVELAPGIEGLVHVSEMSWTKKNIHPGKIISTSEEVDVVVLDMDSEKRRISLGIKQAMDNPWIAFSANHKSGEEIEGEIKNITEFGLFVGMPGDIDGMVHLNDLSWEVSGDEAIKEYQKGQMLKVKILEIDSEKERIALGVKQLTKDVFGENIAKFKKGDIVTCEVIATEDGGVEVSLAEGVNGFIKKNDLARDRADQRTDRFAVGEKVDAKVMSVEKGSRRVQLSIKAYEVAEEKKAMAEYGSSDSGASLGDILGAAMKKKSGDEKPKKKASKAAKTDDSAEEAAE